MERQNDAGRRLREHLFREAVEQGPLSVIITDREGVIEYVNAKVTEVTGYRAEELLGNTPRIFRDGSVPEAVYRELWGTVLAGKSWHGVLKNRKKNGERYWEATAISPIAGPDGEITHLVAIKNDITPQMEAERKLAESERNYREEHDRLQTVSM